VLRIVHVDQRAQPAAGGEVGLGQVVLVLGQQHRARGVDPQLVVPLDIHDVGVLGDRPERVIALDVDVGDRRVLAQVGQGGVQAIFVGVGLGVGEDLRSVIDDRRSHGSLAQMLLDMCQITVPCP